MRKDYELKMQIRIDSEKQRAMMQFLLLFGIEFHVPIVGFLSLRKIAFAILLILYIKRHSGRMRMQKDTKKGLVGIILLFLYALCLLEIRFGEISKIPYGAYNYKAPIFLLLDMVVFPIFLMEIFSDVNDYVRCQWQVLLFQSVVTLVGRFFLPVRMFVFTHFAYGDGRLEEGIANGVRSVGIDLSGAVGSMVLFAGIICGIYLFYQTKDRKEKKNIIIGWLIIIAANLFMGRTGLYFGAVALFLVFLDGIRRFDQTIRWIVIGMIVILIACFLYAQVAPDTWGLRTWIRWVTEIKDLFGEGRTISAIRDMYIPPLSIDTFFGTGLRSGITSSGIVFNHDAGYVQNYTSIGIVGFMLYYGLIYGFYLSMINKVRSARNRRIYLFFLIAIAVGEMKEPFLAKSILTVILSCMLMMEIRQQTAKKVSCIDIRGDDDRRNERSYTSA